jgi:predicted permease
MGGMAAMQDLRYALRGLGRSPLFTVMAVLTMALGIGASTATFSVVGTVLFKELPYREPDRLVAIWPTTNFNNAMLRDARAASPALASASGISGWSLTLVGAGDPLEISANRVSPDHFRVLGVQPALGRSFGGDEGLPGQSDVVILSHPFWVRAFGADRAIVGRSIELAGADNTSHTVIGVMPPDFRPVVGAPDVWIPMALGAGVSVQDDDTWYVNHRVARLAPGATLEQADQQIRAYARQARERIPTILDEDDVASADVQPLQAYVAGAMGPVLWVTLGAVSLVLLIACANVANLLLARGETRRPELAVRVALGAGRQRVLGMLLAESGVLGLAGGAAGILLSLGLVRMVVGLAPPDFPRIDEVGVDGPVLLYAVAVTVVAILVAGLIPAVRAGRVDATASMAGASRSGSGRRGSRLTRVLVAAEVALAVVVTVGSGLMLRSLERLVSVDQGLDTEGVVVFRATPPDGRYPDGTAFHAYYDQLLERVASLPGVERVGAIHLLPGTTNNWSFPTFPEGYEIPQGTPPPSVNFRSVWAGYFETVGVPLERGRYLVAADNAETEKVAVVNQAFVDRYWPDQDPIGRTVRTFSSTADPYRVIGVVGDVRQHGLASEPRPEMYFAHAQWGWNMGFWVLARMSGSDPLGHAAEVREAVWSVDPDVPITGLEELATVFGRSAATTRFLATILTSFGFLALALGAVGVFGVTAYSVSRRIPEFGVRVALGSSRTGVVTTALGASLAPVVAGLVVGLLAAAVASGTLRTALFGIEPSDPVTYLGVGGLLLAVATLASLLPAIRASRVDPVTALRSD